MYYNREKIVHAQGNVLIDSNNKQYIDLNSGTWNVFLGHGRREFSATLYEQAISVDFVPNHRFYHEQGQKLAQRLIDLFPTGLFTSVFFTSGGSEAIESALKVSKQFFYHIGKPNKNRYISLFGSYHGATLGCIGLSGDPWDRVPFDGIFIDSIHAYPQYCYRCGLGLSYGKCNYACLRDLEYKINFYGAENICALIIEPIMGLAGAIIPDIHYLEKIFELCHKNDILIIYDEVSSGMGRTGQYFNCLKHNLFPDILVFGKAISNGVQPLGGMLVSPKIVDAFQSSDNTRQFRNGFSSSGHPVACSVGNIVLDIFENENIVNLCISKSISFNRIIKSYSKHPFFGEIRIEGLMIAIEIINPVTGDPWTVPNLDLRLREAGFLIYQLSNIVMLCPSVITAEHEIDDFMKSLVKILLQSE